MKVAYSMPVAATALLTGLVLLNISSLAQTAQDVGNLPRSSVCKHTGVTNFLGASGTSTMTVKSDGGWCWGDIHHILGHGAGWVTSHDLVVVSPPQHGQLLVGDVKAPDIRVAYRPVAGFAGSDSFVTRLKVVETQITWSVTVTK